MTFVGEILTIWLMVGAIIGLFLVLSGQDGLHTLSGRRMVYYTIFWFIAIPLWLILLFVKEIKNTFKPEDE